MELAGRTAIVTGAGSGIGRELACEFARHGARVACVGRRPDGLDETVRSIASQGGTALAIPTDITERSQVGHMVDTVVDRFGAIELLFNNAGSFGAVGPIWDVPAEEWWQDVTINLLGTFLCSQAVLPHMRAQDRGVIINMDGGGGAYGPNVGGSGYGASKAAIVRLSESLARELERDGSSVLVFTMFPGFVRTAMTEGLVTTEARADWQPFVKDAIARNVGKLPSDCAAATMRLLAIAGPELSGCSFDVETDFDEVDRLRAEIAREGSLTMRLRPLPDTAG
jgi:NAD(P)-dependent dehydrogenase (short-subunit alcohol dehydrogenase family)